MTIDSVPELARRVRHLETLVKRGKPADGSDNASLLKRISALESSVARIGKAAPTKPQVYTPKPAVRVPKPTDNSLALKLAALEREVERLRVQENGKFVALTTPLTSTSWDGDDKTTADRAIVDLSSVFGVPAGVKAVLMSIQTQAAAANNYIRFGPSSTYSYALTCRTTVASQIAHASGIVPCDANGDVYCYTSGTVEGVQVRIWGYWL